MTAPTSPDAGTQQRLHEILLTFLEAAEKGQAPDRMQFLASNPEFAAELAEFFVDRDRLEQLAAPLRQARRAGRSPTWGLETPIAVTRELARSEPDQRHGAGGSQPVPVNSELGQLGDFLLLRQVGRGGMGTVYEAHQISLNRRVALKVLPLAAALDPRQLQRFKNEAQAAAQLHHPHIVPVYAVGCERGVHYYAMQFIDGQSLAALIHDLRRPDSGKSGGRDPALPTSPGQPAPASETQATLPAEAISTERSFRKADFFRRVADLARAAAQALEHAHQLGVVHRDIKPANLLLDARGALWVTDFGLALLHNRGGGTETGELVGTLRYMSPQQAGAQRGLVDHRTDIYSLGASLYELLTLQPLFAAAESGQLLQQIANEEPRPPRSVDRTIPIELETVVLKALAKNPAERYDTAQELADDLQRFLSDRPVRARRPTLWDRARKWCRRHRPVVVAAVVLLLTATAALAVSTILIAKAHYEVTHAYQRERQKTEEARQQRTRAEANFLQARRAIDFLTRLSAEELVDERDVLAARRTLLGGALQYYQEFIDQLPDDPSLQAELAASRGRVAQILADLSAPEDYLRLTLLLMLLTDEAVQEELHLGPAQRQRVASLSSHLASQRREAFRAPHRLPDQERTRKFKEMATANEKAIGDLLTSAQAHRLRQIAFQQQGPAALEDPGVARVLDLTTDQKTRIRSIQDKARRALRGALRLTHLWGAKHANTQQIWLQSSEDIQTLLTPRQQAQWKDLSGQPFHCRILPSLLTDFAFRNNFSSGRGARGFGRELLMQGEINNHRGARGASHVGTPHRHR